MSDQDYSSDQPISSKSEDRFDRWPFAQRIAETLAKRSDRGSLVVGIYGPWGDGKTSVLRMMEETLKQLSDVVVVKFNPWYFRSEDQLIDGFFHSMADAHDKQLETTAEKIGETLKKYGGLLSITSIGGEAAEKIGTALSTVELEEYKVRVEKILRDSQKRILVFIDDIDRLDRREIQAVFKLVKLSGGFENVSYILAFDDAVVADALGEKYGAGGADAGRAFLEKLVQVPLHLPPADEIALRQLAFQGIDQVLQTAGIEPPKDQIQLFVNNFIEGLQVRLETPRQAKRYVNALMFGIPILKGEVNVVDQMLIEGVRVFYPHLYASIRSNPEIFLGSRSSYESKKDEEGRKELFESAFDQLTESEQKSEKELVEFLFPRASHGSTYGGTWDEKWQKEQRICSDHYFHRFFKYGISSRDVADLEIKNLVADATASADDLKARIQKLCDNGAVSRVISKLRQIEKTVDETAARNLALALARLGGIFPKEEGIFSVFVSAYAQAAILIRNFIARIPDAENRKLFATQVLKDADPLPFAVECFRFLRAGDNDNERCIPEKYLPDLGSVLVDRVRETIKTDALYRKFPDTGSSLFWIWKWYGNSADIQKHLKERFEKDSKETLDFLKEFLSTVYSNTVNKGDFERGEYDSVSELIDPVILFEHLRSMYGDSLNKVESYPYNPDISFEEKLARQFAFVHAVVLKEKALKKPSAEPQAEVK